MSKIIIYTKRTFEGKSSEFNQDVSDLEEEGFKDTIASMKVIGQPWVAYYGKKYGGKQRVFEVGQYTSLDGKGQFFSLKMVTDDLTNPEIQLFEESNYQGRNTTLERQADFLNIKSFSDKASSHKVTRGVWVLYEQINCKGFQLISYPGDRIPSYDSA
ncbi:epidermal differentiation-specific protein-like [Siphateles boraxobius]|uniref:epidermal differentiation-specific protein-like n=1 Tax=Siphateles boraxobius TaxID=180520 RepID=UPI004062A463